MNPRNSAKKIVQNYYNTKAAEEGLDPLSDDDVYIVWFSYILGNWKALLSTTVVNGMY